MPRLEGTVTAGEGPADGAHVQIENLQGDFQAEVITGADGSFVLYPVPGRWRLVSWLGQSGRTEQEIEVGPGDLRVELSLS
jgi:hypothetical protein